MSRIRSKDTKPEVLVRKFLFGKGLRYRKNDRRFPGHPDMVFPKYRAVVFVDGCFWHGHEGCKYYSVPKSNTEFWREKVERNARRDRAEREELARLGWRVISVWECELRTKALRQETLGRLYESIVGARRFTYAEGDAQPALMVAEKGAEE